MLNIMYIISRPIHITSCGLCIHCIWDLVSDGFTENVTGTGTVAQSGILVVAVDVFIAAVD